MLSVDRGIIYANAVMANGTFSCLSCVIKVDWFYLNGDDNNSADAMSEALIILCSNTKLGQCSVSFSIST